MSKGLPGDRFSPHRQRAAPAPTGAGAARALSGDRAVRASTHPTPGPRSSFSDGGLSGKGRSSGGSAARSCGNVSRGQIKPAQTVGSACAGWREAPAPTGAGAAWSLWATGRCVRARTLPLGPHSSFSDAGLSGKGRSSGGSAARSCGNVSRGQIKPAQTSGSACPGWREAPAPGRDRRCPAALGDREVRASTHPTAGPAQFFLRRRAERKRPIFRRKSGSAHVGAFPGDRLSLSQQRAAPAPDGAERQPPGGAGAARSLRATGRSGRAWRVTAGAMAPAD